MFMSLGQKVGTETLIIVNTPAEVESLDSVMGK